MHRDPTFQAVLRLEHREIKNKSGCTTCEHRGEHLAWNNYHCKINNQKNQYGSCRAWQYRGDK